MTQQSEKQQDNSWFERGELPPVGVVCEYTLGANAPWYQCEIKYVVHGDGVVMKRIPCGSEQYCSLYSKHPVSFRPIRPGREKAIEGMKRYCPYPGSWNSTYKQFAEALYDSGYRKEPK